MGRGRAKAKQQKVARDLKYNTPNTDLDSLQRELGGSGFLTPPSHQNGSAEPVADDPGADDPDTDDDWPATR